MELFDPHKLAQQLCEQWDHIPMLKSNPCPDPEQLAKILEIAYFASMETEEGRPLKFALILRASTEADEPGYGVARFAERRSLSSSEIRRLAPATGLCSTFIAVESNDDKSFIWGTVDMGSEWSLLQNAERTSGVGLPFHLVITVSAPGTISLKFSDSLLYSVERGQSAQKSYNVLKSGPVHEFFRPVMDQMLKESFPNGDGLLLDKFNYLSYGNEYLRFLARTLRYAEELGHGGTIIVIRKEDKARINNFLSIKYPIINCTPWNELVQYVKLTSDEIEFSKLVDGKPLVERASIDTWKLANRKCEKLGLQLIDHSRFLARLTQVDGALILTEQLEVLGFGAIIKDLSDTSQSFRFCKDESCVSFDERERDGYGTRHRSTMSLCEKVDCIAFVLSQDGGVKALMKQANHVLLWQSVLLDLNAWFVTPEDMIPQSKERYLNRCVS
jgi:hypothetical protein